MVVDAYKTATEGQDLAEGDKHAVVYLRQRRQNEARHQQPTPKSA